MPLPPNLVGRVFTRGMATSAGVTSAALGRLNASGRIRRVLPAVWADAARVDAVPAAGAGVPAIPAAAARWHGSCAADDLSSTEALLLDAATLLDAAAVVSHGSAARLWGIDAGGASAHVTVPRASHLRSGHGLVVHRDALAPGQVVRHRGRRVSEPFRTVLDVARSAPLEVAVITADALLWAERVEREELLDRLVRLSGARGLVRARRALDLCRYGAASPGETRLRLALVTRGVPEPKLQHAVECAGQTLVVDLSWPRVRLAVEYDGFDPHMRRPTFERDRRRWSWLRDADWELRAYTAESIRDRGDAIAAEVTRLLEM